MQPAGQEEDDGENHTREWTKSSRDRVPRGQSRIITSKESRESKELDGVQLRWRQGETTGLRGPEPGHVRKPIGAREGRAEACQFPRVWDRQKYGSHSSGVTGLGHRVEAPVGDGETVGSHRPQGGRHGQRLALMDVEKQCRSEDGLRSPKHA